MMKRYLFPALLFAIMLHTASAFALTCKNDYAGASGCAANATSAGDCATIGYSKTEDPDCGHYVLCPFDSTYKRCVSKKCTNYTLSACPKNGICVSCQSAETVTYALAGCKSGFAVGPNNTCVTSYSSCEAAGYFSDNTNMDCAGDTVIYITGSNPVKCFIGCECASGYVDVNGVCIKTYATCEAASYYTIGEHMVCEEDNKVSIDTSDTDSSKTVSCCSTAPSCESGYVKNGDGACVKTYESCVAADKSYFENNTNRNCTGSLSIYLTDGTTKTCYIGCTCKTGYTTNSSTGNCEEAQCPSGSSTSTTCSGNAVAVANGSMSGTRDCYSCNSCTTDYAVSAEYCGTIGSAGWTLSLTDKDGIGCRKCTPKACPERSSTSPICMPGQEIVEAGYTGDKICYKCEGDPSTPEVKPTDPVTDPCDCPDDKPYLCDGVCTATGDNSCLYCLVDDVERPVVDQPGDDDDSGTPGSGGGGTGGGGGGDGEISRPSDCQPGYDYCKIDPLHKCCSKQEDDAASSVQ